MQDYELTLTSPLSGSFRCVKAANSVDLDVNSKAVHHFNVTADIDSDFNVGLIVGASGSGKTTLARHIYGDAALRERLDLSRPIIDQFPESMSYDECVAVLTGVGLSQVPCWIRTAATLSNGQRARAECALAMCEAGADNTVVIDEWTSVVDRVVARAMSYCIQKHARRQKARIVLMSCHYDVLEWLNPDWIIDCNTQTFTCRRSLWRSFERSERLTFEIGPCDRQSWRFFSRYHYLSEKLPGGLVRFYGIYIDGNQMGFQCFANYTPHRKKSADRVKMHSNRTVIHPDYCGLGLGIKVINATSLHMAQLGFDVRAKYSSEPVHRAMSKYPEWQLESIQRDTPDGGGNMLRVSGFRKHVKTYSYRFLPERYEPTRDGVTFLSEKATAIAAIDVGGSSEKNSRTALGALS